MLMKIFVFITGLVFTFGAAIGADDALFVDENGNIGVGTETPTHKLHIAGSQNNDRLKIDSGMLDSGVPFQFLNGGNAQGVKVGALKVWDAYAGEVPTNGAIIQGNVGIGTAEPVTALHVNGGVKVTGSGNLDIERTNTRMIFSDGALSLQAKGNWPYIPYLEWRKAGGARVAYFGWESNVFTLHLDSSSTFQVIREGVGGYAYCNGFYWVDTSDKALKDEIRTAKCDDVLNKIDRLDVFCWKYKGGKNMGLHIGPMAKEFRSIFKVGNDDKGLASMDTAGVALAGIKGLIEKNKKLKRKTSTLEKEVTALNSQLSKVLKRLAKLEKRKK